MVDIIIVLYDEEEIMRSYVESERHDARYDEKIETAKEMIDNHEPVEKIIRYSRLLKEVILELQQKQNL